MGQLVDEISRRCPGGLLPVDIGFCDSETSGLNLYSDRALQYGFAFVMNKKVVSSFSQIVKRPGLTSNPHAFAVHGITSERMEREGVEAGWFIGEIFTLLTEWRAKGHMFGGHNLMAFDAPMLELEMQLNGLSWKFGPNEIIDTGMLVKAAQLGMFMKDHESLRDFYFRIAAVRARGIYWSLDRYCYETFELEKRTGIKRTQAHDAAIDCVLAHGVLEALREEWQ